MKKWFRYKRYTKFEKGKLVFDVGWSFWIGKFHIRYNKQNSYSGLGFEWWGDEPTWLD